ncbi:MAG: HlyD family type I secretion periplasmic adaptor subunit [Desulfobacterales bacterium]
MNDTAKKPESTKLFYRMPAEDIDLVTDIRAAIQAQSPRGGRTIIYVVLILTVFFFIWASVSEIEEVTRGEGKVIPSSQIQVVQNLEGGILSEILVDVGDIVKKGQLLLRIDGTRFSSSVQENRTRYLSNLAKAARLTAEADLASRFEVPKEVMNEKPEFGEREKELFESRKKELLSNIAQQKEQITQRKYELNEYNKKLEELSRTYDLLKKELALTRPLVEQRAVSEVDLLRLERQASTLQGEIATIQETIPKTRSKYNEAQIALKEIELAFSNKAKTELNDVLAQIEGYTATAVALEDRLKRTYVRSPVNGTVNRLLINTVGGVIMPGMDLIEIVPLEDTLLIETKIKPSDIAFLRPKQKAMVKFTAYDYTRYGGLEAELEHIGADSITDDQGNSFYLVKLRTRQNYLESEDDPLPIIPGMIASVDILIGKKTILTYLLKPVLRAKHTALRER